MKQVVVLSGKGGTGKTFVSTSLMYTARNQCVAADCDVDAADVHLVLGPTNTQRESFVSGKEASLRTSTCRLCGRCVDVCHFGALSKGEAGIKIDSMLCEGCGYCAQVCPDHVLKLTPREVGFVMESDTRIGAPFVHARLNIGAQNSGKLVSEVKKRAVRLATKLQRPFVIVDGSPGTGCPVIASVAEADYVVIVLEPTMTAIHDAKRVIEVVHRFHCPIGIILNKASIHEGQAQAVEVYALEKKIPLLASIPYDLAIPNAISNMKTIPEHCPSPYTALFENIWSKICLSLEDGGNVK